MNERIHSGGFGMAFHPVERPVPAGFATDEIVVRPLRTSDAAIDFEAVIESREMLRMWEQSDWPADDFTLEDNRADLEKHETEHEAGQAFTFTIMDPTERTCLGCIYIHGLRGILEAFAPTNANSHAASDCAAFVTFWVRASRLQDDLDARVLRGLIQWFDADWAFDEIVLGTNTADVRQQTLFMRAGFVERWRLPLAHSQESHLLFVRSK
jgi:RimJ/RimL family protein N-acetyltransferase